MCEQFLIYEQKFYTLNLTVYYIIIKDQKWYNITNLCDSLELPNASKVYQNKTSSVVKTITKKQLKNNINIKLHSKQTFGKLEVLIDCLMKSKYADKIRSILIENLEQPTNTNMIDNNSESVDFEPVDFETLDFEFESECNDCNESNEEPQMIDAVEPPIKKHKIDSGIKKRGRKRKFVLDLKKNDEKKENY